jgi:hypothetical protein
MNANQIVDLENKALELAEELKKSAELWFKDEMVGDWVIKTLRKQQEEIDYWKEMFERAMEIKK